MYVCADVEMNSEPTDDDKNRFEAINSTYRDVDIHLVYAELPIVYARSLALNKD